MQIDIVLIILFVSIIQSIFGVGILLFGTPLLIIFGYSFNFSLSILLPISILVSFFQVYNKLHFIDIIFYKKILLLTIPPIIVFLFIVSFSNFNIQPIIGLFLIIIALDKVLDTVKKLKINQNESLFLVITGIIHGISNLGGALLSSIIFTKKLTKDKTRATIAISYLTFAIFQIVTLKFITNSHYFDLKSNLFYCFIGLLVYLVVENLIFIKINEKKYNLYFTLLLFTTGLLLIIKT